NKYPDEAYHGGDAAALKPPMLLSHYRLDMASACMGTGYVGKRIARSFGAPELLHYPGRDKQFQRYAMTFPIDYDEYHRGENNIRGWLGRPLGPPERVTTHLGPVIWRFGQKTPLPTIETKATPWQAAPPARTDGDGLRFAVTDVGLWRSLSDSFSLLADLPLSGIQLRTHQEYTIRFRAKGTSPFTAVDPRYRAIPCNLMVRLKVDGRLVTPEDEAAGDLPTGYIQEFLVFEDERECILTLIAPADGAGSLQICLSENLGEIELHGLEIREGCADVMTRRFEHGLVLLNGANYKAVDIPVARLFPGERYRRLQGKQDPIHNNGEPVGGSLHLDPRDGIFLVRI
ncbi:MAG: hypothetical protein M1457_13460, partial [bacterium]|nr:hypothetical protein [bacterium]